MTTTQPPRRLRADAARNRQALIDAAERMFAARGLSVTLDDIAAEAGVNVATAYRHFANKHELVEAFLRQKIDHAIAVAEEAVAIDDPWHGLTDFLTRILGLITHNRGLHDVFMPGYASDWLAEIEHRMDPLVDRLLSRARAAKVVRKDLGVGDLGVLLQMLATVSDLPDADETLVRRYLAIALDGLRPTGRKLPGTSPNPADVRAAMAPRPQGKGVTAPSTARGNRP